MTDKAPGDDLGAFVLWELDGMNWWESDVADLGESWYTYL